MRHFAISIFLLVHTTFTFGQIANDGLSFFNYSYDKSIIKTNKVKTVTIDLLFSKGKSSSKSIYHFDKEGLLTKLLILDSTDKLEREFFFFTNSHKDLISRIQKDYENKKVDTVHYFKFYEGNKLVKDSSSEIPISYTYEYSSNGNLIKTIVSSNFGLGNNTKRITVSKFDSSNRIVNNVETVFQNENDLTGTVLSDRDCFYGKNGRIEREVEKLNGKYSWMANKGSIKYVFDESGNLTQILRTNAASYFYTYNDKGLVTTKKMDMKLESDDIIDKEVSIETLDKFIYSFRQ
jgi:hypothetical protein